MSRIFVAALLLFGLIIASASPAAEPAKVEAPKEADYYRVVTLPIPPETVMEVGALEFMPNGKLAVATRRGEVWMVDKPLADPPTDAKFTRFASGLHEVLGLAERDGWLYVTQRCDVSRIKDTNGDGVADLFEVVNDDWGVTGDYHEYAFGSKFDKDGNIWVVLCLTGSFNSNAEFRGWCLRITPDGKAIPTTSGIRSPGGIGMNAAGDMFYTDNQGPWNGACNVKHLVSGDFVGHPAGFKWYEQAPNMGPQPPEPTSGSRMMVEAKKLPRLRPPVVYFPYNKMGQSASGIACDTSSGRFGPFKDQLFVGDQSHSTVMRVSLEKIKDHYQGACYPFREGLDCGSLALQFARDGSLMVGGTNRGWGSRGTKPYSLQRLVWSGQTPFEVQEMRAKSDGFELSFTKPADRAKAADPASYKLSTYTYIYQAAYGSPEVDPTTPTISKIIVSDDGKTARLYVDGLQEGHVHELHLDGVLAADGLPLLHKVAYYTLNYLPAAGS